MSPRVLALILALLTLAPLSGATPGDALFHGMADSPYPVWRVENMDAAYRVVHPDAEHWSGNSPSLGIDSHGVQYVAWDTKPGGVHVARLTLGVWMVDDLDTDGLEPRVMIDDDDRPHVVWISNKSSLRHAWRDDAGWHEETPLALNTQFPIFLDAAMDNNGGIHVVFEYAHVQNRVYLRSTPTGWSIAQSLGDLDESQIAVDSTGRASIVGSLDGDFRLFTIDAQGSVTRTSLGRGYYMSIAIDQQDQTHLAFEDQYLRPTYARLLANGSLERELIIDSGIHQDTDIEIGPDGSVHMLVEDYSYGGGSVLRGKLYYLTPLESGEWTMTLVDGEGLLNWADLAIGPDGVPRAVYEHMKDQVRGEFTLDVRYAEPANAPPSRLALGTP